MQHKYTPKWTAQDILTARHTPLKPVLEQLGYRLQPRPQNNWEVTGMTTPILIKDHFWRNDENTTSGNAIDLLTRHANLSFSQAMDILLSQHS